MRKISIKGEKVLPEEVETAIESELYMRMGKKIAICHLTLVDGHEVIGHAGVVNHKLFNYEIGNKIAKQKAIDKVWQHMGSILQERRVK